MNIFVKILSKKKILRDGRLKGCLILIAATVIPLIIALVFSESMMSGITEKYVYLTGGHITTAETVGQNEYMEYSDKTASGYALLYSSNSTSQVMIKGVEESYFKGKRAELIRFAEYVKNTTTLKPISISLSMAEKLQVNAGDKIAIMSVSEQNKTSIKPALVFVESVFTTDYDVLDKNLAFTDLNTALNLFGSNTVNEIILKKEYIDSCDEIAKKLQLQDYSLWNNNHSDIYMNFITSRQAILIIMLMVTAMAAIYTSMVSSQIIFRDMKESAQLKLLGCKNSIIKKASFFSVISVCILGFFSGLITGIVLCYCLNPVLSLLVKLNIQSLKYYLLNFSIVIPWKSILIVGVSLIALASLCVGITISRINKITPMQLFTNT